MAMHRTAAISATLLSAALLALPACTPPARDADVIVIGAGIAGLSAALEAEERGAKVIVLEAASVGGGHAVKAGGFALVGTPLQEKRGYRDDAETAIADLLAWGEDADPGWVRRYVENSRGEVHDWLEHFGVRFTFILDTPQHSVPRFHFAGGGAVNVVLPLLGTALTRPGIDVRWNAEVIELLVDRNVVTGAKFRDARTGDTGELRAPAVIVATGGFESDLDQVRENWRKDLPQPERLYVGAGYYAKGSGIELGREAGAALARMDRQTVFTTGNPDPRDATGTRALLTQNPSAIWVDAQGKRFIDETGPSKAADDAVLGMTPATHWLLFDSVAAKSLRIRDAIWLSTDGGPKLLDDPAMVMKAGSIADLAKVAGLPPDALEATVARYNAMLATGVDEDFGRFTPERPDRLARPVSEAPFYAIQLFPLTRKSMGGLRVDEQTRVLDVAGEPIRGLYAAGEVTGVAGINGSYGGEGTFLGPSVYMGRLAGRASTRSPGASSREAHVATAERVELKPAKPAEDPDSRDRSITMAPAALDALLDLNRPGYWHFEVAHRVVAARQLDCTTCHTPDWPTGTASTREQHQIQLRSCLQCH